MGLKFDNRRGSFVGRRRPVAGATKRSRTTPGAVVLRGPGVIDAPFVPDVEPSELSDSVASDPDSFVGSVTFDLGEGLHHAQIQFANFDGDPDGETWGDGNGEILIDIENIETSADDDTYHDVLPVGDSIWVQDSFGGPDTAVFQADVHSLRYLRITNFRIINGNSHGLYDGSNNPTASCDVYVDHVKEAN